MYWLINDKYLLLIVIIILGRWNLKKKKRFGSNNVDMVILFIEMYVIICIEYVIYEDYRKFNLFSLI